MSLQGKSLTKKQAEIIENIVSYFETIHEEIKEYGQENMDFQDTKASLLGLTEDLSISFGSENKKIFD